MKDAHDTLTRDLPAPKRSPGRPSIHGEAMTPAEKQARYREGRMIRLRDTARDPSSASDSQLVDLMRYNLGVTSSAAKAKVRSAALELAKRYK